MKEATVLRKVTAPMAGGTTPGATWRTVMSAIGNSTAGSLWNRPRSGAPTQPGQVAMKVAPASSRHFSRLHLHRRTPSPIAGRIIECLGDTEGEVPVPANAGQLLP